MTSTEIERHQGNTVALTDEHYLSRLPQLAEQLAHSGMCPEAFKGKPNDICIIGYSLADNGLRLSINTLPQCYVVKGRPGYMAQIQTAMAALHGIDIHPVGHRCDENSATVEVILPNGQRHEVTFTMEEARRAGLDKTPGEMYRKFPTNMLVARATTRAISWYCPAVKLGLAGTIDMEELGVIDATSHDAPGETGEVIPIPAAKKQVLEMVLAHWPVKEGETDEQRLDGAKQCANVLWLTHNLPSGQDMIPVSRLRGILSTYDEVDRKSAGESPAPAQAPEGDEPVGEDRKTPQEPELVTPEIVRPDEEAFDGSNADALPFDYSGPDGEPF